MSTASASSRVYISKPTAAMNPCCSAPRMLPAPRISRSRERDLVAGTEVRGAEDGVEPLARDRRQRHPAPVEQVGVRPAVGSAHPAAQLVELRQAERVGADDDDRVGIRDVEAGLDDGGAHQDVEPPVVEVEHHPLEHPLGHLAVADGDPRAGHQAPHALGGRLDRLDAVVDVEDLPAAVELAADRVAHQPVVVLRDPRLDREAGLRRRLDHRQVADADEGEVQGARDRRGRQGQHVDLAPHRLDALLVRHAEALLLVHDEQAEIGEADVLREDPMRPDQDVDAPRRPRPRRSAPAPSSPRSG